MHFALYFYNSISIPAYVEIGNYIKTDFLNE